MYLTFLHLLEFLFYFVIARSLFCFNLLCLLFNFSYFLNDLFCFLVLLLWATLRIRYMLMSKACMRLTSSPSLMALSISANSSSLLAGLLFNFFVPFLFNVLVPFFFKILEPLVFFAWPGPQQKKISKNQVIRVLYRRH